MIVPPLVKEEAEFASKLFKGGSANGLALAESYECLAQKEDVFFLNPLEHISVMIVKVCI